MKNVTLGLMAFAACLLFYSMTASSVGTAQTPTCERPACRSGDRYSTSRRRCESGPSGIGGYRTHYPASCPAGYNLDEARGVCVWSGQCCEKSACKSGYRFRNGRCESGPSGIGGYRSHYYPQCDAGWDLTGGMCRRHECGGDGPQGTGPQIDRLGPTPCVDRGGTATIYGSGFGPAQRDRVVELGGHGIGILLRVTSWSDTEITVVVPDDRRIEFGQWYYIGLQNAAHHWITNISRNITICRQFG